MQPGPHSYCLPLDRNAHLAAPISFLPSYHSDPTSRSGRKPHPGPLAYSPAGGPAALVGIATYDSAVHFYSLRSPTAQPQMLVMSDTQDVFAPNSGKLLMELEQHRDALKALLEALPEMWAANRVNDNCAGAAIEVGPGTGRERPSRSGQRGTRGGQRSWR